MDYGFCGLDRCVKPREQVTGTDQIAGTARPAAQPKRSVRNESLSAHFSETFSRVDGEREFPRTGLLARINFRFARYPKE